LPAIGFFGAKYRVIWRVYNMDETPVFFPKLQRTKEF
jgi:hypothetical protein